MADFLDRFAQQAKQRVYGGYYNVAEAAPSRPSLRKAIQECKGVPIIAEAKAVSPSLGAIRENIDIVKVASAMRDGGAVGISVLTEPDYFRGSLDSFIKVRKQVRLPLLMKDFIVSPAQLEAASKIGANAVLLIKTLFDRGYCESDLNSMIEYAHSKRLEVLLEAHTAEEFSSALDTDVDFVGINNRDLRNLRVDVDVTKRIMEEISPQGRLVISESGIETPSDICYLLKYGVNAFLVGSSIMTAPDVEGKVRELVNAI